MNTRHRASFRDPAGYLYRRDGVLLRQVTAAGAQDLEALTGTGLYEELTDSKLLVEHSDQDRAMAADAADCAAVLRPTELAFISYPYEWCFSQLKDAALLTLELQRRSLERGVTLKDASAYNVQFVNGKPIFIDTLSFAPYREGEPWAAYRQFCQHFLAPLALMAKIDVRLLGLTQQYIDGIPLDLAVRLLGKKGLLSPGLLVHLHLHARSQRRHAGTGPRAGTKERKPQVGTGSSLKKGPRVSLQGSKGVLASLKSTVESLSWQPAGTEWIDYYEDNNNYSDDSLAAKQSLVLDLLGEDPGEVWDLGANTGRFSRAAATRAQRVVSWDIDPACVEANYRAAKREGATRVLPLLLDLTNPSPALGWAHAERQSLAQRCTADALLALGLVHHLAVANNVPLAFVFEMFRELCAVVVLEWVPKTDSQVQRLLASRTDIFDHYTTDSFEDAATEHFGIVERRPIAGTERVLYKLVGK